GDRLFDSTDRQLGGIDLRRTEQESLLEELKPYYDEQPFAAQRTAGLRYYFENEYFSYADALYLHCLIRHRQPSRLIEVGSGFSSCVILDTNERFFDGSINCTHIEPFPETLEHLLEPKEIESLDLRRSKVQDIPLELFDQLEANDILFVDSTH
ncbi:MAG: class I SAM-dependent methyltransferase, partial [Candidatus Promineifilaceae bacterium]